MGECVDGSVTGDGAEDYRRGSKCGSEIPRRCVFAGCLLGRLSIAADLGAENRH